MRGGGGGGRDQARILDDTDFRRKFCNIPGQLDLKSVKKSDFEKHKSSNYDKVKGAGVLVSVRIKAKNSL